MLDSDERRHASSGSTSRGRELLLWTIAFAVAVFGLVPVVALGVGISPIVPLGAAVVTVLAVGVLTRRTTTVLTAGTIVFLTVNADVPLAAAASSTARIELFVVDPFLVAAILALATDVRRRRIAVRLPSGAARAAAIGVACFVVWTWVSGIVAVGGHRLAGIAFATFQTRALVTFAFGYLVVRRYSIRTVAGALLVPFAGHALLALVMVGVGGGLGLSVLGDQPVTIEWNYTVYQVGPVGIRTGLYAGGFTGTSRVLSAALLIVAPILGIELIGHRDRTGLWHRETSLGGLVIGPLVTVGLLVTLVSTASSTMFGAVIVTAGATALFVGVRRTRRRIDESFGTPGAFVLSVLLGLAGGLWSFLAVMRLDVGVNNVTIRRAQYRAAARLWADNPLLGVGGQNFQFLATEWGVSRSLSVHNVYLALLAETGIGLAFFLLALGGSFAAGLWLLLRADESDGEYGLLAGMLVYLAIAAWTEIATSIVLTGLLWLFAGLLCGRYVRLQRTTEINDGDETATVTRPALAGR